MMRFYRGIAVPAGKADETVAAIIREGLNKGGGRWEMLQFHPGPIEALFGKLDLSLEDTRPKLADWQIAICACGEVDGALHYAWRHNRTTEDDTPILIEFIADAHTAASGLRSKNFGAWLWASYFAICRQGVEVQHAIRPHRHLRFGHS
jgi:hypothetical protein